MIKVTAEVEMYLTTEGRVVISNAEEDDLGGRDIEDMVKEYCSLFSFDDCIISSDCVECVEDLKKKLVASLATVDEYLTKTKEYELQSLE